MELAFNIFFKKSSYFLFALLLVVSACKKDVPIDEKIEQEKPREIKFYQFDVPLGFPLPNIPENNPMTVERVELGKRMFFDKMLSRDNTISCGSCHFPHLAFTDGLKTSIGIEGRVGPRNSPTLINTAYVPALFMEGGVPSLELLVLAPIEDHNEMDFDIIGVVERMKQDEYYSKEIKRIFGSEPTAFNVTRALGAYQRSLVKVNSRFDDFYYNKNENAINEQEKRGMVLFFGGKTNCSSCHTLPHFTNFGFYNVGLYENYQDDGRALASGRVEDIGRFKVPTLRNIELTAPYMHDGSIASLEEVVDHFDMGGFNHVNKSHLMKPLNLSQQEKEDLVSFLKTLTNKTQFKH